MLSSNGVAAPLGLAEFAARLEQLGGFEHDPFIAVAVSGGPDSLALTILADRWVRLRGGRMCALSVDHGLRPESTAELRQLAAWLAARGIDHRILVWRGEKPSTHIQERARAARYRLLQDWCREEGCLHLLIGHHRDDQVETYRLRRAAQSGRDGLAAMAPVRETAHGRILRPLLAVPKSRLLATLAAENQPFVIDPSNCNPVFARARLREHTEPAGGRGVFAALSRHGRARARREHARDALLARAAALHPAGFALLDRDVLAEAPRETAMRALSALVGGLGNRPYPPRRRSVERLFDTLLGTARGGRVLAGLRFVPWRRRFLVLRELAAAAPPTRIEPGASLLWDGRFQISAPATAPLVWVRYLGSDGVAELHRCTAELPARGLPPLVHPVLASLWDPTGLAAVPALGFRRPGVTALPQPVFALVNCLSRARFAVV